MRIYTRGANQCLLIDREITVTVLAVHSDHVRIGVHSPKHDPAYWESDLYLPDQSASEFIELELTIN